MGTTNQIDAWAMSNNDRLTPEQMKEIRSKMEQTSDSKVQEATMTELKSPTMMLIISLLAGCLGIDRFMLGQTGLGILKLITVGACGVWAIIDWFTVMKRTKSFNYKKLSDKLA